MAFRWLPTASSVNGMSDEVFDFTCTRCEESNKFVEAVRYCVECLGYCCQSCTDLHQTFPALKTHRLLASSQRNEATNQQSRLPEFPTERCSTHKGEVLDQYCLTHNDVGCSTCMATDHKSCPDKKIYSVPDMVNTLFNLSESKQIQSNLKSAMASMTALSHSKHSQLEELDKAQVKALEDITTLQTALEAFLKKAADKSRQAVKDIFKKLEDRVFQQQIDIANINDVLNNVAEKIDRAEANRAQLFSCMKVAERKIKDAEKKKFKLGMDDNPDLPLLFIPDQSLLSYLKGLQDIGEVKYVHRINDSSDIKVRVSNGSDQSNCTGLCQAKDNTILVTDMPNKKLKRIDILEMRMKEVDSCFIGGDIRDVCCISEQEAAVTCGGNKMIQIVSIGKKMKCTRQIKTSHGCGGITSKGDQLYVTDCGSSLYVYDMFGNVLRIFSCDSAVNSLFTRSRYVTFNNSGTKMYVTDLDKGVVCFDSNGRYLTTFTDAELQGARGACVDADGNVFVCGIDSHNVVQFNEDGIKIGVILKQQNGLHHPRSVCFHQGLNKLFVTMADSDVIKMYELE